MGDASYITPIMVRAMVCERMKWTYQEYDEQPSDFLQAIATMMQAESKHQQKPH